MSDTKRPIHEILSERLVVATTQGLRNYGPEFVLGEIATIILAFHDGKMKAADAHKLAKRHADLPTLLTKGGLEPMAEDARKMLANLAGRVDEEKLALSRIA